MGCLVFADGGVVGQVYHSQIKLPRGEGGDSGSGDGRTKRFPLDSPSPRCLVRGEDVDRVVVLMCPIDTNTPAGRRHNKLSMQRDPGKSASHIPITPNLLV